MTAQEKNIVIANFCTNLLPITAPDVQERFKLDPTPYTTAFDWLWEAAALCRKEALKYPQVLLDAWMNIAMALQAVDKQRLFENVFLFTQAYENGKERIAKISKENGERAAAS